jgi:hypothetical protein
MTIATYSDLQSAVASWLARDDLTSQIPDFITLFEASACRKLRVRPTEASATLTPSSGAASLPSDFLGVRRLTWEGSTPRDLDYVHPSYLQQMYPSSEEGVPTSYTIEASTIRIRPSSDESLTLIYRAKTAAVSGALNWLFTSNPDIYLFGALTEAYMFNRDAENAAIWRTRTEQAFNEIKEVDFHYRGRMSVRVDGPTP